MLNTRFDYTMKTLTFRGRIGTGVGRHVELGIPGRTEFDVAPGDWPENLQPGSLNVRIDDNEYPPELLAHKPFNGVPTLDSGLFQPAFVIPQDRMTNNKLTPLPDMPQRGSAQVWRATLVVGHLSAPYSAWVLRRFGSRVGPQLELVSDVHLRDTLSLKDGMEATVALEYGED